MYVDVLKRDAGFEVFYSFFDNIGVTKLYICVHFLRLLAEQIVFCRSIIHFYSAVFQCFATFMLYKLAPIIFIL